MGKKPQSVPELSSAVNWAAQSRKQGAFVRLCIVPESEGGQYVYAGAELVVALPDGAEWVLRRVTERVSGRSDSTMCAAMFRGAISLQATYEGVTGEDLRRLAEWDRGARQLRSVR